MKKLLLALALLAGAVGLCKAQTHTFPAQDTNNTFQGTNQFLQGVLFGPVVFASLPGAPPDGTEIYCSDCQIANPCASGGTGAYAQRFLGAWVCTASGVPAVGPSNTSCNTFYNSTTTVTGDCNITDDGAGNGGMKSLTINGTGTPTITIANGTIAGNPTSGNSLIHTDTNGGMLDCTTSTGGDCLRPWVDVRNGYGTAGGVDCTGATDSTANLQAIINAVPDFTTLKFPNSCKVKLVTTSTTPAITIQSRYGLVFWFEGRQASSCDTGSVGNGGARFLDTSTYVSGARMIYINQSQRLLFHNVVIESDGAVDVPLDIDQTTSPPITTQNVFENLCVMNNSSTRNANFKGVRLSNAGISNMEMQWFQKVSVLCASVAATSATSNGIGIWFSGNNANQKNELVDGFTTNNCSVGVSFSYGSDITGTNWMDSQSWTNVLDGTFNTLLSGMRFENSNTPIGITNALGVKTYIHIDFANNTSQQAITCGITISTGGCSNVTLIGDEADNSNDWFGVAQGQSFQGANSSLFAACNRNLTVVPVDFQLGMFVIPCAGTSWYGGRNVLDTFGFWMTPPYQAVSIPQNYQSPPLVLESNSGGTNLLDPFVMQLVPNGSFSGGGGALTQTFEMVPANPTNGVTHWLAFTGNNSGITLAQIPSASVTALINVIGANNSATWSYVICAHGGTGVVCGSTLTTSSGASTLNTSNYNNLQIVSAPGATYYDIYRTASGGTPATTGKIGTIAAVTTSQWWTAWAANNIPFNDQGAAGDSTTPPSTNTTGMLAGTEISTPTTFPAAGMEVSYYKAGAGWCSIDHSGTERCPGGGASPVAGTLCSSGVQGAITGNSAAQNIYSCSITAGQFVVGNTFRVQMSFKHTTGTASIPYNFKLGGTSFNTQSTNGTNLIFWQITCTVTGTNAEQCMIDSMNNAGSILGAPLVPTATETTGSASSISVQFNVANTDAVTPEAEIGVIY